MSHRIRATLFALCACGMMAPPLLAQAADSDGNQPERALYIRSVARVFGTSATEARLLAGWLRHPSDLPVLLYVAERAGVSPDIVGSLRKSGASWQRLATKLGLSTAVFQIELDVENPGGVLARPIAAFRSRPPDQWYAVALTDAEIVALVNVRVLAEAASVSPGDVAAALDAPAPDVLAAYANLVRARLGVAGTDGPPPLR